MEHEYHEWTDPNGGFMERPRMRCMHCNHFQDMGDVPCTPAVNAPRARVLPRTTDEESLEFDDLGDTDDLEFDGPAPPVDSRTQIEHLCAGIEDSLGMAITSLLDGYEGSEGEGAAWEAGRVAGGLPIPSTGASTIEKLEHLVSTEPLGVRYADGQYSLQHGKVGMGATTLGDVITRMYESKRPACPACGSTTYGECFGTFTGVKFVPERCDRC